MATRKTGKIYVKLFGGPYHGSSIQMTSGCGSLTFKCKDFFGYYTDRGSWKSLVDSIDLSTEHCAILGYN